MYPPAIPTTAHRAGSTAWQTLASAMFTTTTQHVMKNGVRVSSKA
ncbi:hypothetical protein a10_09489 [Streptomyces acidiscabies]|nr:hypothetical protein a10_09489 [Streptomyces acidiscabies]